MTDHARTRTPPPSAQDHTRQSLHAAASPRARQPADAAPSVEDLPILITAQTLCARLPDCLVFDVRHDLTDHAAGHRAYQQGHIPGAVFLDHEQDLAAPRTGTNGRHPLPPLADFAALMRLQGLTPARQAVVYDDGSGAFAAHLWWMLRWLGHARVAVLDGGWPAWVETGGEVATRHDAPNVTEAQALAHAGWDGEAAMPTVTAQDVLNTLQARNRVAPGTRNASARGAVADSADSARPTTFVVLDARAPQRFRGEVEPMDPVAGHIPGAMNRPASANMTPQGRFKPAAQLRAEFQSLLGDCPATHVVHQCGSGITACQNLFAMELAGLHGSQLYPGSWSEWCSDPSRPVATGE